MTGSMTVCIFMRRERAPPSRPSLAYLSLMGSVPNSGVWEPFLALVAIVCRPGAQPEVQD